MDFTPILPWQRPFDCPQSIANLQRLSQLVDSRPGAVIWQDSLVGSIAGAPIHDVRGIYHFVPRSASAVIGKAIDFAMLALGMGNWYMAKRIRRGLLELLIPYYAASDSSFGCVLFESCRDTVIHRFQEFTRQGVAIEQLPTPGLTIDARSRRPVSQCQRKPLRILGELPLSLRDLPLVLPEESHASRCFLRGSSHDRWIIRPGRQRQLLGRWRYWCLAEPCREHYELLRVGRYTVQVRGFSGGLNPSRIMTWMIVHPRSQLTYNLCLDFDPWSERVLSIRYVETELRDYIDLDPRFDIWLNAAMYYLDRNSLNDEQVDSPTPESSYKPEA